MLPKNFTSTLLPPPSRGLSPTHETQKYTLPTPTTPNPPTNPAILTDALHIRQKVFIDEQHCSAEEEVDADEGRSWHWVVYYSPAGCACSLTEGGVDGGVSTNGTTTRVPVATVRLVPPPNVHHNFLPHGEGEGGDGGHGGEDEGQEPYIKLTRVAVLPEFRGYGLGRAVVEMALEWAARNAAEIDAVAADFQSRGGEGGTRGQEKPTRWQGLVLVHAQTQVEKMYMRCGFVTDETMGRWHENEIEHLGMWRRLETE
ncbi:GNAT family N-acetyltransferase [Aspergillus homomorphus CBS 101889]|uniref:Glucosamine 6-phosphate N-acetyltransferase n=1 Tax=Aspergillus homomorphus (strain CBS 101889) TaxID=1450537 RepID=A0A395I9S1_ASPHC|nr:hypothetical protein BO97DRAFT_439884 [Aspergillus homomorphus CBS 101889]RAL16972.1 hypothetical protein BO97DRAFT_439884 [Aspergillus homomorphus CBS 101889]